MLNNKFVIYILSSILVLSVFHATTHTFSGTNAMKIIENHNGKAFIKQQQTVSFQLPTPPISPLKPI